MFAWAPKAQGLMRAHLLVPADPRGDAPARRPEAREQGLPGALFFKAPEEALDDAVLLGRVGRDELLVQPVGATCSARARLPNAYYHNRTASFSSTKRGGGRRARAFLIDSLASEDYIFGTENTRVAYKEGLPDAWTCSVGGYDAGGGLPESGFDP
jgi:hypothetical protein